MSSSDDAFDSLLGSTLARAALAAQRCTHAFKRGGVAEVLGRANVLCLLTCGLWRRVARSSGQRCGALLARRHCWLLSDGQSMARSALDWCGVQAPEFALAALQEKVHRLEKLEG